MPRVLALLLAFALLFQASWAVAATYCAHETSPQAARHFGHHAHVHKDADGQPRHGSPLAVDDDCASCHAGHPALVPAAFACLPPGAPAAAGFARPRVSVSAPPGEPERPRWTRLA